VIPVVDGLASRRRGHAPWEGLVHPAGHPQEYAAAVPTISSPSHAAKERSTSPRTLVLELLRLSRELNAISVA